MCGIFGLISDNHFRSVDYSAILAGLNHRGPDDQGVLKLNRGILAHTRLAIMDLSTEGHQPMLDASRRYSLVFNGEIYNYESLRNTLKTAGFIFRSNSDTEVILHGFSYWGKALLPKLRGMFAFAIHDSINDKLLLARDRLGIKPLLYTYHSGNFVFASELKVLCQQGFVTKQIDSSSLVSLFQFGAVSQPQTILKDVQQIMPGHYLELTAGGSIKEEAYVSPLDGDLEVWDEDYQTSVSLLREQLEETTSVHLLSEVEIGCFLSGGIDSTAVLGLMQRQSSVPISAFSLGFSDQKEVQDESSIAKRTAAFLGSKFHRVEVSDKMAASHFEEFLMALDQPSIDGFNTFLVSKAAGQHVKVVLSGLGGDELFGGYPHFSLLANTSQLNENPLNQLVRFVHSVRPNRFTKTSNLIGRNVIEGLQQIRTIFSDREISCILNNKINNSSSSQWNPSLSLFQNISIAEITGYMLNTLLRDTDVLSMWNSLEVRPVLLDQKLVEFSLRLPDEFKIRDGQHKAIFVDAVHDLIPNEVWNRPKTGFELPFIRWMNGDLQSLILDLWHTESASEILQPSFLKAISRRTQRRKLNRRDWLIVVLVGWLEMNLKEI